MEIQINNSNHRPTTMKIILNHLTSLISRGAFRSARTAMVATVTLLLPTAMHAYDYDRRTDTFTFTGTITTKADFNYITNTSQWLNTPLTRTLPVVVWVQPTKGVMIYTPIIGTNPAMSHLGSLIDTTQGWEMTKNSNNITAWELVRDQRFVPFGSETNYDLHVNKIVMPQPGSWTKFATSGVSPSAAFAATTAVKSMIARKSGKPGAKLSMSYTNGRLKIQVTGKTKQDLWECNFNMSVSAK